MFKRGEVYDNPVAGERVVIRLGNQETGGERLIADIYVRPGGAVAALARNGAGSARQTLPGLLA